MLSSCYVARAFFIPIIYFSKMKLPVSRSVIYFLLLFIALLVLSYVFTEIVVYIALAIVLSALLRSPTNYISQLQFYGVKVPRIIATLIAFSLIFGLASLFVYLFVPLVSTQIEVITALDLDKWLNNLTEPLIWVEDFLIKNGILIREKGFIIENIKNGITEFFSDFDVSILLRGIFEFTGSFLVGLLAVLFITFFILYEKGLFRRNLISLIPNKYFEVSIAALSKIEKLLSNYLLGLLLQMVSIFSIASFGLLIVGVEYAVTIAVFAAVANLIPYLGPFVGATFGLLVGLTTDTNLIESQDYIILISKILAVFSVVQITDNIFLQPIIFSKSVKAHPLEIFLIVFVGANLGGTLGMIIAIPFYTILKVTFIEFYRGYQQYQVFRN